jgi:glycosyltransferase involved in cell wall biosynthesis
MRPSSLSGAHRLTVILATFEAPEVLETTLRAFSEQDGGSDFEIVVADDGSGDSIATVVEAWRGRLDVRHVWQPDEGFRKARALDLAALSATGEYLVFLDADCVPRSGLIESIRRAGLPGWFLTTKRIELSQRFTAQVLRERRPIWRWSAGQWLLRAPREIGRAGYLVPGRDRRRPWRPRQPDFVPPYVAYCMFGMERKEFVRVNGYDARCTRSDDGEDQDLAIRLRRSGLRCGWPGPGATVLHLWHAVRTDKAVDRQPLFRETEQSSRVEAVIGLREIAAEEASRRSDEAASRRA